MISKYLFNLFLDDSRSANNQTPAPADHPRRRADPDEQLGAPGGGRSRGGAQSRSHRPDKTAHLLHRLDRHHPADVPGQHTLLQRCLS